MVEADFQIKPEKGGASVDTASWPLLLKVRIIPSLSHKTYPN